MPLASVTGLDHVVILVHDLDDARARFARLRFTVSPRGTHSAHMGTANHTLMLREDYLELLAVVTPTEANERWRKVLAKRQGLAALALRTSAAAETAAELEALGHAVGPARRFSRPIGNGREAAFHVTVFPPSATPELSLFVCEHLTRDAVWLPELQRHANGALGLASVTVVTNDPGRLHRPYEQLFGTGRVFRDDGDVVIDTGSASVRFQRPETFAACYPGVLVEEAEPPYIAALSVRVRDLDETRRTLQETPTIELGAALCVRPAEACGVLLRFEA
jgi:catechol 2,3-dioxygenase-like lactoylglutathione lyase family enzyme